MSRFNLLARLFVYPDESYAASCRAAGLNGLADFAESISTAQFQEQFTETFDWNPATALEIGWHLFGEDYARGEFLTRMRAELRRYGLQESGELPDHLTHVLALLGRLESDRADEFSRDFVSPAVGRLISALDERKSPFAIAMRAVWDALPARGPIPKTKIELPVLQGE
jgi:nitrate reductase delta subunit